MKQRFLLLIVASNVVKSERLHPFPLSWIGILHHSFEYIGLEDALRLLKELEALAEHLSTQIMHGHAVKIND